MNTAQAITDKFSMTISLMCVIHCLALTSLLALLPSMAMLQLDNEAFHLWMVVAVIPSSIYALTLGCKQHKCYQLIICGSIGLLLLIMALFFGEEHIGEVGEKILTVLGAGFVAIVHWFNFLLCQAQNNRNCACSSEK